MASSEASQPGLRLFSGGFYGDLFVAVTQAE
jgi:hypothetical protein